MHTTTQTTVWHIITLEQNENVFIEYGEDMFSDLMGFLFTRCER